MAELRNGWHIISPVKSFTVYAATAMEKADWMMHVNRCVQDLRLKSKIFCLSCFSSAWALTTDTQAVEKYVDFGICKHKIIDVFDCGWNLKSDIIESLAAIGSELFSATCSLLAQPMSI